MISGTYDTAATGVTLTYGRAQVVSYVNPAIYQTRRTMFVRSPTVPVFSSDNYLLNFSKNFWTVLVFASGWECVYLGSNSFS